MKNLEVEKSDFTDALYRIERVQKMGLALLKKEITPFEQPTTIEELKAIYARMSDMREDIVTAMLEISRIIGADMAILAEGLKQDNLYLIKILETLKNLNDEQLAKVTERLSNE